MVESAHADRASRHIRCRRFKIWLESVKRRNRKPDVGERPGKAVARRPGRLRLRVVTTGLCRRTAGAATRYQRGNIMGIGHTCGRITSNCSREMPSGNLVATLSSWVAISSSDDTSTLRPVGVPATLTSSQR